MAKILYIHNDDQQLLGTILTALKQNGYAVSHSDVMQEDLRTPIHADVTFICQPNKDQNHLTMGGLTIDVENISVTNSDGQRIHFTPTEFAVLAYLVQHSDRAISRNELLPAVWGCENHGGTRMADDTIKRLRRKIADSRLQIHTIWGYGFKAVEKTI